MENQENRRKNSGSNQKRNAHDKNKPGKGPNAKNKYKNNQDSTNKTKATNDNKPYQHPTRTNADVPRNTTRKPNQSSKPNQSYGKPSNNPQNLNNQVPAVPGPSHYHNQRQNYSGQNYGNPQLKYTSQQNWNSGYQMVNTVTTQRQNYNIQHVQYNQNYRNPQLQSINHQEYYMVNGIATHLNNLTLQLGNMRPNPYNMAFNQQVANMRPNPFNIAFNQARGTLSSTATIAPPNFHNEHWSEEEDLSTEDIHNVRKWENPFAIKTNPKSGFVFSVMSYNVLAQDLIYQHAYLYRNHDQDSLNWDVRWNNLLQEIKDTNPDIMCLQEVQETHIQNYFSTLSSLGYEGIYKKRTGVRVDGCAIYYKKDNVTALEHTTVEYRQPDVPLLDRDNVGLVVKFAPKLHPTKEFVVATTHLLYNPRREDVRLAQAQLLLTEVERISYKRNNINKGDSYLPVIITGDFNALPDSNLFKFISTGELHYNELAPQLLDHKPNGPVLVTTTLGISDNCQHVDLLVNRNNNITVPRSEELKLIKLCSTEVKKEQCSSTQARQHFSSGTLSHNFQLRSVYDNQKGTTNQDGRWIVVDYIFYSTLKRSKHGKLHPLARYGLPQRRRLKHITIPNKDVGSDHFSLIVKFKLD